MTTSTAVDIIEYVNVAHSIGSESETLFKITGTCGQDPMVPLIANPSFFLTSIFFHVHNILQLSMYDIYTKKNNQTAVSIHTGFLTDA